MTKKINIALLALLLCASCTKVEDILMAQHEQMVKYLTGLGLVAEENLDDIIDKDPLFYSTFDRYVYRHIVNYYDEGRDGRPEVKWGSTLELYFDAYIVENGRPTTIYWSNTPATFEKFREENPNFTVDWSTEPLRVTLGATEMIEGLNIALPGCRERDSVQLFITSNLAYGKKIVGEVPKNTAVAWYVRIDKVE